MKRLGRALAVTLVGALALLGVTGAPADAGGSRAVVIIDTGDGSVSTQVISFSGTISGYQALELAGANPETYGYAGQGAAICRLLGVGNDPSGSSCLGTAENPDYWAYFRAPGGAGGWQYSRAGAGSTTVSDGDVEGWKFGRGGAPAFRSFCDVAGCGPPPAPPAAPEPGTGSGGGGEVTVGGANAVAPGGGPAPAVPGADTTTSAAADGSDSTGTTDGDGAAAVTTVPTTGGSAKGRAGTSRGSDSRALGARPVVADDGGSGSPVGALVALALVAGLVGLAVVLRRRGRRAD